jgi:hypothetical protein
MFSLQRFSLNPLGEQCMNRSILLVFIAILISGCAATRSSSNIESASNISGRIVPTLESNILVTEEDILDLEYISLGDIEVSVSKTTIFNKDPSNEMIDEELKKEAAKLGADAVILVRYGTVGVSAFSWGKLDGKGRAIKFVK